MGKSCNFHIRNLYAVKPFLDGLCLLTLVHSLILSRVDYCNCVFDYIIHNYLLKKVQSVLNRTAEFIFGLPPRTPTTAPFLIELNWFPVKARIEFKIFLMTFKAHKFRKAKYLVDLLNPLRMQSDMVLRSGDEPRAVWECSFAARSFYSAPGLLWSHLRNSLRLPFLHELTIWLTV